MAGENFVGGVNALYDRLNRNTQTNPLDLAGLLMKQNVLRQQRNALEEQERENALAQDMSGVEDINDIPIGQVMRVDPRTGINLINALAQRQNAAANAGYLAQKRQAEFVDDALQMLTSVESEPDESLRPQLYRQMLGQAAAKYPKLVPLIQQGVIRPDYDPVWNRAAANSLLTVKDRLASENRAPYTVQQGKEVVTYKPGLSGDREIGRGPKEIEKPEKDSEITIFNKGLDDQYLRDKGRRPTPAERLDEWNKKKKENSPTFIRANAPLSDSDETLAREIAAGRMAPSQMAKRTGNYNAVLARATEINPALDIRQADMDYGAGKTSTFRARAITMNAMPEIIKNVAEAGKKLDYSDVQFVGRLEAWKNRQLNDPDYVNYMTLRNDALLSIAFVMRGAGATDQAARFEEEAANPTMSPRALDAWMDGQLKSMEPRLREYRSIYGSGAAEKHQSGPPLSAFENIQEGKPVRFKNGQVWAVQNGKPVRMKELEK